MHTQVRGHYNSRELARHKKYELLLTEKFSLFFSKSTAKKSKKKKLANQTDLTFHLLQIDVHFKG